MKLRSQGLRADEVQTVSIQANRRRLPHTDNPSLQSALGAKFSMQYATERALLDGPPRLKHFEGDAFLEPMVTALLAKTSVSAYPPTTGTHEHEEGNEMAADVTVLTKSGRTLHMHAPHQLGRGGEDPMSEAEVCEKYSDCAGRLLPRSNIDASFSALLQLQSCADVSVIARLRETES